MLLDYATPKLTRRLVPEDNKDHVQVSIPLTRNILSCLKIDAAQIYATKTQKLINK